MYLIHLKEYLLLVILMEDIGRRVLFLVLNIMSVKIYQNFLMLLSIKVGFRIDFLKLRINNFLLFTLTWICFSRQKIAWNSFIRGLKRAELLFVMIMVPLFVLEPLKPVMNF